MQMLEDIMVRDGTTNLQTTTWVTIKGKQMTEKRSDKKFIVMSKFPHSDRYMTEKAFSTRNEANKYAELMMNADEYENIKYFCFEQTMDYEFFFSFPIPKDDGGLHG